MNRLLMLGAAAMALSSPAFAIDDIVTNHLTIIGAYAAGAPAVPVAGIGELTGDTTVVPYERGGKTLLVPGPCGTQEAASVFNSVSGAATNGGPTSQQFTLGHVQASGEAGVYMSLASVQAADGPTHDAVSDSLNCTLATPPLAH